MLQSLSFAVVNLLRLRRSPDIATDTLLFKGRSLRSIWKTLLEKMGRSDMPSQTAWFRQLVEGTVPLVKHSERLTSIALQAVATWTPQKRQREEEGEKVTWSSEDEWG